MNAEIHCPHCGTSFLLTAAEDGSSACSACGGMFIPGSAERSEMLKELAAEAATVSAENETAGKSLVCPACAQSMRQLPLGEALIDFCPGCGGAWLDAGETLQEPGAAPASPVAALARAAFFGLSLPERLLRSTIGMAAGAASETTRFLVPQAFQSSKTYELVVRNSLNFLTQDIGGVKADPREGQDAAAVDNYVARKAVGNFVDMAGFATLHLSPVWIMAVVSDLAYGTKGYLLELADELKKQGLIDENSTIHHVDDVLDAIQNASGNTASLFDTPPLSVEQLRESVEKIRSGVASADYRRVLPEAELASYWSEMRAIAGREGVSLIGVSGALTMHTLGKVNTISRGTLAGVQVVGGLFRRQVIGHYAEALGEVREKGFYEFVDESSAPYIEAVWNNFSSDRETWTEQVVSGRFFGRAFRAVSGLFAGPKPVADQPPLDESSCRNTPDK